MLNVAALKTLFDIHNMKKLMRLTKFERKDISHIKVTPYFLGSNLLPCGVTITREVNKHQVIIFKFFLGNIELGHMYYTRGGNWSYEVFDEVLPESKSVNQIDEAALWLLRAS